MAQLFSSSRVIAVRINECAVIFKRVKIEILMNFLVGKLTVIFILFVGYIELFVNQLLWSFSVSILPGTIKFI